MRKMKKALALILATSMMVSSAPLASSATEVQSEIPVVEETLDVAEEELEEVEENTEESVVEESEEEKSETEESEEEKSEIEESEEEKSETEESEEEKSETEESEEETEAEESEEEAETEDEKDDSKKDTQEKLVKTEYEIIKDIAYNSYVVNTEGLVDAAIFGSDVHGSISDVQFVFGGVSISGADYSTVSFAGDTFDDTQGSVDDITSAVKTVLSDDELECIYTYGEHDAESDVNDYTGLVYGASADENYYIYAISANSLSADRDISEVESDLVAFEETVDSLNPSKPLFIVSHMPLHHGNSENECELAWYEMISYVAEEMDVVFLWGHNHENESAADIEAYYVEKNGDETIVVDGEELVPNFTYMNAGYINADNQISSRKGVVTTVLIYEDHMIFQDYGSTGRYTDASYSHNVTVSRDHYILEERTVSAEDDYGTIEVTATSLGLKGINVWNVWGEPDLSNTFTDYVSYEIELEGYVEGNEILYTMTLVDDIKMSNFKLYYVSEDGTLEEIFYRIADGVITFTTDKTGIFAYGPAVVEVPETAVLKDLQVTRYPKVTKYFVEDVENKEDSEELVLPLNIAGLEITATFNDGTQNISKQLDWNEFGFGGDGYSLTFDMTKIGVQDVEVSYTYGDVTLKDTFEILICHEKITDSKTNVSLDFKVPGVTKYKITDNTEDEKLQKALAGFLTNFKSYHFEFRTI